MKLRIALWAGAGFLIAGFWAIYVLASRPPALSSADPATTLVQLTCPIAVLGAHHAISVYTALLANAVTYGLIGAAVEGLRQRISPGAAGH